MLKDFFNLIKNYEILISYFQQRNSHLAISFPGQIDILIWERTPFNSNSRIHQTELQCNLCGTYYVAQNGENLNVNQLQCSAMQQLKFEYVYLLSIITKMNF